MQILVVFKAVDYFGVGFFGETFVSQTDSQSQKI
jgi:hypothetical protein